MTIGSPLWLTAGVVVGGLHAASLWQAAHRASRRIAATGVVRLLGLAAILVSVALDGGLLQVCMGWSLGFLVCAGLMLRRDKTP